MERTEDPDIHADGLYCPHSCRITGISATSQLLWCIIWFGVRNLIFLVTVPLSDRKWSARSHWILEDLEVFYCRQHKLTETLGMGILLSTSPYFCSCLELSGIDLLNRVGLVHLLKWWLGYEFGTSLALFFFFSHSKWDVLFHGSCINPWPMSSTCNMG